MFNYQQYGLIEELPSGSTGITHVQGKTGSGSSATTVAATFTTAVTSGDFVCGLVGWSDPSNAITINSVSDDQSNTYTVLTKYNDSTSGISAAQFYLENITNGPVTVTVTFSTSVTSSDLIIDEFSDIATSSSIDGHTGQSFSGTGSGTASSGNITTTVAGDLIYGGIFEGVGTVGGAGSGFTLLETVSKTDTEYEVQSAAGSIAGTFSVSAPPASITTTAIGTTTGNPASSATISIPVGGVPSGALVGVCISAPNGITFTVTDSQSNSYSGSVVNSSGASTSAHLKYVWNATALVSGNTITVTPSASTTFAATAFYATGVQTSSNPLDVDNNTATGTSTSPSAATSGSTASSGELIVGLVATNGPSSDTFTQDSSDEGGFTSTPSNAGTNNSANTVSVIGTAKNTSTSSVTSLSTSTALTVAVGDLVFVSFYGHASITSCTISDNLRNTWTALTSSTAEGDLYAAFTVVTTAGSMTPSATITSAAVAKIISAVQYRATAGFVSSPLDVNPSVTSSTSTGTVSGPATGTLAQASELLVGYCGQLTTTAPASLVFGTDDVTDTAGSGSDKVGASIAHETVSATSSVTQQWTMAAGSVMGVASFKLNAASPNATVDVGTVAGWSSTGTLTYAPTLGTSRNWSGIVAGFKPAPGSYDGLALVAAFNAFGASNPGAIRARFLSVMRIASFPTGAVPLLAHDTAATKLSGHPTGIASLLARGNSESTASATPKGSVSVLGRMADMVSGFVTIKGKAALAGAVAATVKQLATPTGKVGLLARATEIATASTGFAGRLALSARASADTAMRGVVSSLQILFARMLSLTTAHSSAPKGTAAMSGAALAAAKQSASAPAGKLALFAHATADASSRATFFVGKIFHGLITSVSTGRGGIVGRAVLTAKATAQTKQNTSLIGKVGLTALVFAKASTSHSGMFIGRLLSATLTSLSAARTAVTGKLALSGRATAQTEASTSLVGRVGLTARSFAESGIRVGMFAGKLLQAMMTTLASARTSFVGKVPLRGSAESITAITPSLSGRVKLVARSSVNTAARGTFAFMARLRAVFIGMANERVTAPTGKLKLAANSIAQASARSTLRAGAELIAVLGSLSGMAKARAPLRATANLAAKTFATAKGSFGPVSPMAIGLRAAATFIANGIAALAARAKQLPGLFFVQSVVGGEGNTISGVADKSEDISGQGSDNETIIGQGGQTPVTGQGGSEPPA